MSSFRSVTLDSGVSYCIALTLKTSPAGRAGDVGCSIHKETKRCLLECKLNSRFVEEFLVQIINLDRS